MATANLTAGQTRVLEQLAAADEQFTDTQRSQSWIFVDTNAGDWLIHQSNSRQIEASEGDVNALSRENLIDINGKQVWLTEHGRLTAWRLTIGRSGEGAPPIGGLEERRALRLGLMDRVYQEADGSTTDVVDPFGLFEPEGVHRKAIFAAADYLVQERLLDWEGRKVSLTHAGVTEVEAALAEPTKPTAHFPPAANVIYIKHFHGALQQGTVNSQQTVALGPSLDALRAWIVDYQERLADLHLGAEDHQTAAEALAHASRELAQPNPREPVLRAFGQVLYALLLNVTGSVIAAGLLQQAPFGPN